MLKKLLALVLMLCATLAMAAVDVNKANEAQLESIKGIGPSTSKTIVTERKKGEFKSWEDFIERVKGVSFGVPLAYQARCRRSADAKRAAGINDRSAGICERARGD
jgi:competence protein ComEA